MDDKRPSADRLNSLEGADAAALGIDSTPESAPPGAEVDADEQLVPGADFGKGPTHEAKPWFTSNAAQSGQAGVANVAADDDEDQFPAEDESPT